ncbi:MAG: uroporphyrinogen-III C-methyltransferase [Elusimicrobia bacterium]|nr:uroporphyrinogen-III C-methyltransferase [Elusimicrobiota bacterium]
MKRNQGKVYLVGAGPGDPELLTLKAVRLLKTCDAVLYDSLVPMEALTLASQAEKIHVGKWRGRDGRSSVPAQQRRIETLMTELAGAGKTVVRLKGGDPVLFGRVGEEAEHLARHGIAFEIVPGVTSALAVPAYAGIPVTDRRYSSQLTVVTGHEKASGQGASDEDESRIDWEAISPKGTLIFLMCVGRLEKIKEKLLAGGWPPEMPACIIERGTTPFQKTVVGTLGDIAARARRGRIQSPAMLVVGKVVGLRKKLRWFAEASAESPMPEEEFNPCLGKSILSEPVPEIRS